MPYGHDSHLRWELNEYKTATPACKWCSAATLQCSLFCIRCRKQQVLVAEVGLAS